MTRVLLSMGLGATLFCLFPSELSAQTYYYGFDKDTAALSGTDGWEGAYCADPWATHLNGGVVPLTDDGCWILEGCGPYNHCGYEFAYFAYCQDSDPFDNHIKVGSTSWTDYEFTAKFRNDDDDAFGLVFRYQNSGQFYLFLMTRDCAPSPDVGCTDHLVGSRLMRIKDGDAAILASSPITYEQGTVHTASVTVEDNHITAGLDLNEDGQIAADEIVFDLTDNAGMTSGKIGLYAYENGFAGVECMTGNCWFDDVTVTLLEAPPDPCGGISYEGTCEGNTLKYCDDGQLAVYNCPGCCQWIPYQGYYNCVNQNQCQNGFCLDECYPGEAGCNSELTHQLTCGQADEDSCLERIYEYCVGSAYCNPATSLCSAPACLPDCAGKTCGDDGCGGSCGECDGPQEQCAQGVCTCLPLCEGKECGIDGCGGSCGECTDPQEECLEGLCNCVPWCEGKECGDDGCAASCGACAGPQDVCVEGLCICQPQCVGKECGDNGCGAPCGLCGGPLDDCVDGLCVCQPACLNKACGDDGCDGLCGVCPAGQYCDGGVCTDGGCVPLCAGKECGFDGCGGLCGECPGPQDDCVDGLCVCQPFCAGKECGDDGCGSECGVCPADIPCVGGVCKDCEAECLGKECGDDGCGGVCGMCGEGYQCNEEWACEKKEPCAPRFAKECVENSVFWFDSCGGKGELVEKCDGLCLGNECVAATVDYNTSDVIDEDVPWVLPDGEDDFSGGPGPDTSGQTWDNSAGAGGDALSSFSAGAKSGGCAQTGLPRGLSAFLLCLLCLGLLLLRVATPRKSQ